MKLTPVAKKNKLTGFTHKLIIAEEIKKIS